MTYESESFEIQKVLSQILEKPFLSSQEILKIALPEKEVSEQIDILSGTRKFIESQLNIKIESGLPKTIHHLRFSWKTLRLADNVLRVTKAKNFPQLITPDYLNSIFKDIFPAEELHDCLTQQLCIMLGLEPSGGFVKQYSGFLKPVRKPRPLDIKIKDSDGNIYINNLKRIIYWIIRRNRFIYVEIDEEIITIHFEYLIDHVKEELSKWCKKDDLRRVEDLNFEIENQINFWLEYCCLYGDNLPPEISEQKEIVDSFIKENNLKNKIFIRPASEDPVENKRILELESEISEYAQENRKLENEVQELKKQVSSVKEQKKPDAQLQEEIPALDSQDRDFIEFLRVVDSKYSFDILRSVQLGDEKSITMKNFLAHFFYSLRKKGVVTYPSENEFELTYEQSGLYNCIGFEVPPDGKATVKTEKPGWALSKGGRIFPIKKAVLRLV
jgi:hypothetical protein